MTFASQIEEITESMRIASRLIHRGRWQGVDVVKKPDMATYEITHVIFRADMTNSSLEYYQGAIKPSIPWADAHFAERVCGKPINPGVEWKNWPYALSAQNFLKDGKFNHNYMERYWPKYAGKQQPTEYADQYVIRDDAGPILGIYHPYGDLADVIKQLARDPYTRQAVLPVWFPEDTGVSHGKRVPCSLMYQFFLNVHKLDITYMIRSCDFVRHFRDDIYLTVRLLLWVLDKLRLEDSFWYGIQPGEFIMHITSLHMFRNDYIQLWGKQ